VQVSVPNRKFFGFEWGFSGPPPPGCSVMGTNVEVPKKGNQPPAKDNGEIPIRGGGGKPRGPVLEAGPVPKLRKADPVYPRSSSKNPKLEPIKRKHKPGRGRDKTKRRSGGLREASHD